MSKNLKIGTWEAIATIGCISLIPTLLTIPTFTVETIGTATFLHSIYTSIITFIFLAITLALYKNFANMDIFDVANYVGGKPLLLIFCVITLLYLLVSFVLTFSEFIQNLQNVLLQNAPQEYISIIFGVVITISVFLGIRGIFRTGSIITPLIVVGFLLMFFSLQKDVDLTNFFPVFGNGVSKFFVEGFNHIGKYEGVFFILLITPFVKDYKKIGYFSFFLATFFIIPSLFLLVGIFPYPSVMENYFPIFELTRLINLGRFIQRVESIFILLWLLATFIYLSLALSFIVEIFQKMFNIKYSHRLIPVFSTIAVCLSCMLTSHDLILKIRYFVFSNITPIVIIVNPLILLIVARIKRRYKCKKLIVQNSSS